jgi:predicted nucleic acid-binding protein
MSDFAFLLDSSVLLKLYFREEEDADTAVLLRDGYLQGKWEIRLADISFYELANSLHYSGKFSPDRIDERIQSLLAMEMYIYGFDASALRIALNYCSERKIAIYDAYLVALAKRDQLNFVTADEKLRRKLLSDPTVLALSEFRN